MKLRVLHIVTSMTRGGLENMLMDHYRNIDRNEIQFDFLTHRSEEGEYDDEIVAMGGRIFRTYPIHPRYFLKYREDLDIFFSHHQEYPIVHSHLNELSSFALHAAKKAKIPIRIAHSHITDFEKDIKLPLRLLSKRMMQGASTHYWGCSMSAIRFMFGDEACASDRRTVLNNAIDSEKFVFNQEIREVVRKRLGLDRHIVFGHIGRFVQQKNHAFLIEIFHEVYRQKNNTVLLLLGDGPEKQKIQRKAARLGLGEAVKFLGIRSDIPDLMQAMDVFLLPSRFEGLGIVSVEAQAAGLPVVASDVLPQETALTDFIRFLPLRESAKTWANEAIEQSHRSRHSTTEQIKRGGYDIRESAKKLQNLYRDMI